jgi:hypothetical protein
MTTNSETTAVLTAADIIEQEAEEGLGYVLPDETQKKKEEDEE